MTVQLNWREYAACRDADPELFFPVGTAGPALRQIQDARRICRGCPAQAPCLAWALDHGITDGVWGGTTEDQRRAIRSLAQARQNGREDDDARLARRPATRGTRNARPAAHDQPC
jgi:WhiB family redox-sensing transcriptional regulator